MNGLIYAVREARHRAQDDAEHMTGCVCNRCEDALDLAHVLAVANWLDDVDEYGSVGPDAAAILRNEVAPPIPLNAEDAIERVRDLHRQRSSFGDPFCSYDNQDWPCRTIRALEGTL